MNKHDLRNFVKQQLAELTDVPQRSEQVRKNISAYIRPEWTLLTYVPFGQEVIPFDLTQIHFVRRLAVPKIIGEDFIPVTITSLDDLQPGPLGIFEPKTSDPLNIEEIDAVFVPGLAFDRQGNRLGRGKGFYDRFLKQLHPAVLKIGIAFNCQIFDVIPVNSWDVPLDAVVSERGNACVQTLSEKNNFAVLDKPLLPR